MIQDPTFLHFCLVSSSGVIKSFYATPFIYSLIVKMDFPRNYPRFHLLKKRIEIDLIFQKQTNGLLSINELGN